MVAFKIWPRLFLPLGFRFHHPAHAIRVNFRLQRAAFTDRGDHSFVRGLILIHAEAGKRVAMTG